MLPWTKQKTGEELYSKLIDCTPCGPWPSESKQVNDGVKQNVYLLYALPTQKQNKNRCLQASRSQASFRMVCSPQLRGYASIRSQPSGPTAHQPHQHGGKRIPFEPVTRRSLATAPVRSKSHSKTPTHGNGKNKRVNLPALA